MQSACPNLSERLGAPGMKSPSAANAHVFHDSCEICPDAVNFGSAKCIRGFYKGIAVGSSSSHAGSSSPWYPWTSSSTLQGPRRSSGPIRSGCCLSSRPSKQTGLDRGSAPPRSRFRWRWPWPSRTISIAVTSQRPRRCLLPARSDMRSRTTDCSCAVVRPIATPAAMSKTK